MIYDIEHCFTIFIYEFTLRRSVELKLHFGRIFQSAYSSLHENIRIFHLSFGVILASIHPIFLCSDFVWQIRENRQREVLLQIRKIILRNIFNFII